MLNQTMTRKNVYLPTAQIEEVENLVGFAGEFSRAVRLALELLLQRLREGESLYEIAKAVEAKYLVERIDI